MTQPHKPGCTCTATQAETMKRTAIIECDYNRVVSDGIPYGGQLVGVKYFCTTCERPVMHEGPDPRAETWEERFDKKFDIHLGAEPSSAKSFIASEIEKAVLEERRRIAEEVAKLKFTRKVTTDRIVFHDLYQDEVSTNRTVDAVLAIINPK